MHITGEHKRFVAIGGFHGGVRKFYIAIVLIYSPLLFCMSITNPELENHCVSIAVFGVYIYL